MSDAFLDAIGVKDPEAPANAPASNAAAGGQPKSPQYDPTDLAVRLAMLEDATPEGRAAVAGVMANRAKAAKGDLLSVLTAPAAFEPWAKKQAEIAAIDPNSDAYKQAAAVVLPVLQGKAPNPAGEALNFYSPESQAALAGDGRPAKPPFDDGTGVRIGGNLFFGAGAQAPDPGDTFLSTVGVDRAQAEAATPPDTDATGLLTFTGTDQKSTPGQSALVMEMHKGGVWKEGDPAGTPFHPFGMQPGATEKDVPAGAYFITPDGHMKRAPGGPEESSLFAGLGQGGADVLTSLSHLAPGSDDSQIKNMLLAGQQIYGAKYGGDTASGLGRFVGQAAASAPLLGGLEVPAAAVISRMGPVGAAITGEAAKQLPALAKLGVLAGRGAAGGAGAAGLTASANDNPLALQLGEGAAGGLVLGPAVHGVAAGGRMLGQKFGAFLEPHLPGGPARIADRQIANIESLGPSNVPDMREIIPGSTPTYAQARGSAPLAQLERNLRDNPITQQPFHDTDTVNNAARQEVVAGAQGDPGTVADLARVRGAVVDAHRAAVFGGAGEANSQPVVAAIDEALASPEAHHPEVRGTLGKARDALVTEPDQTLSPDEQRAFHRDILATAGGSGEALTPEALSAAKQRLGAKFEDIAGRTNIIADQPMTENLQAVLHDASQVLDQNSLGPLHKLVENVLSTVQDGQISGASYKALIRKNGPLDLLSSSRDGAMRHYAGQIRETLDDALERTMSSDFPGDRIPRPKTTLGEASGAAPEPASAAQPQQDLTDQALNLIRARREKTGAQGPSLADALIKAGGITDAGSGDMANLGGADYGKRGGLLNRKGGMNLDAAAQWAQERGYIGKPDLSERATPQELLDALRKDLDGKERVYSQGPGATDEVRNHADDLEEMLHEMGVDPASQPNGRIKQKMAEYFGTSGAPGETVGAAAPAAAAEDTRTPEDLARGKASLDELRTTRLQYKNLKTLEAALRTAGPDRLVSPRAVYNAVKQNFGQFAYKGGGPLGDVAEAALGAETKGPVFERRADQVFALRENLQTRIDKLSKDAETNDAARAAASRLTQVRDAMDKALGESVPGYDRYRAIADSTAEPIEAQRYLQSLPLTTNGPRGGTVTLNLVNKALDRIDQGRSMPGPHPAKAVTEHTISQLRALQADLERQANSEIGKARGSPTHQLGVSDAEMAGVNVPLIAAQHVAGHVPLIGSHVAAAVGEASANANRRVLQAMANRLVNPEPITLTEPRIPSRVGKTLGAVARPVPAAIGGLLSTRLLGGH